MKYLLTERGVYAIRFLHKIFSCLDVDRVGILDESDFRWGLQNGNIFLNQEELVFLVKSYEKKGGVAYKEMLTDLRGTMNQNRVNSVIDAYKRVQKVVGNNVTLEALGKMYDAKKHPEVLSGKKTDREAFQEFIWSWDNIKPDYVVEIEEFAAYFEDLSAMIPRD